MCDHDSGVGTSDELPADFARETAALRRIARGILFEPSLAEDAVQEAWLAALRAQRANASSGGWLNESVRRIASGLQRGEARRVRRERAGARSEALPSAADSAARVELLRELLDSLQALDEPYRTAVQLRLVDDLPPRAIAQRTNVPVETARTRVKRGIEQLRQRLDARHAHRRDEFLGLLAPLAGLGHGVGTVGTLGGAKTWGGALVGTKAKLGIGACALLVLGTWWTKPWEHARQGAALVATPDAPKDARAASGIDATFEARAQALVEAPKLAPADELERRATNAERSWHLRARVLRGQDEPFANAAIQVSIVRGYEGPGESVFDAAVQSSADGTLDVALVPPTSAVRVTLDSRMSGFVVQRASALVLRGEAPPEGLEVRLLPLDVTVRGLVLGPQDAPAGFASIVGRAGAITADGGGRFEILASSFAKEERLSVGARGCAEQSVVVQTFGRTLVDDVVVHLAPGAELRGRVIDEGGQPVAGAVIQSTGSWRDKVLSAEDGRFVLGGLAREARWLSVWFSADGYANQRLDFEGGRPPASDVEIVLHRGLDLAGRVTDETGAPLPGTDLFTGESAYEYKAVHAVARDDGSFVLRCVPRTTRRYNAARAGFAPFAAGLTLPESGPFEGELAVVLGKGRVVRGVVVDDRGAPLAGVGVYAERDFDYLAGVKTSTNADGSFELAGLPTGPDVRSLQIECFKSGYTRRETPLDATSDAPLRIELARSAGLAGQVLDAASGQPVRAFRVRFVPPRLENGARPMSGYSATWSDPGREVRDDNGRWSTRGDEIATGETTALEITAAGYAPSIVARATSSLDFETSPIVVSMHPGARVRGVVVDGEGRPLARARVRRFTARDPQALWTKRENDAEFETLTDTHGAFELAKLPLEPMSLFVELEGRAPAVDGPFEASESVAERRIVLAPGAALRITLRDARGRPRANESIGVSANEVLGLPLRRWQLVTNEGGVVELADLGLGRYSVAHELSISRQQGIVWDLRRDIELVEARPHELELRPGGTARIVGTIRGTAEGGTPSVSAEWTSSSAGVDAVHRGALAREGHFELEGLEAGHWKIFVYESGAPRRARIRAVEVDVVADATSTVEVDLTDER